jgi:tRNA A-37 threonylcarbamoyl transferase component Bud32
VYLTTNRHRFVVCAKYASYFPEEEYGEYGLFLNAAGDLVKSEARTRIVILKRRPSRSQDTITQSFVLKIYLYPLLPRVRTAFRISKAEREFANLRYINQQGLLAAEPVAFGVERTGLGLVRSCFLITSRVEGVVDLSQWKSHDVKRSGPDTSQSHDILKRIGRMFRRLHEARFFLLTAKTKNLLIRRDSTASPEIFFIDVPYARTLRWRAIARWAQGRDLGLLLANFYPALTESETSSFYHGYLPDPLGASATALRRYVKRAMQSQQNITPTSALVHDLKRNLRRKWAAWRAPTRSR